VQKKKQNSVNALQSVPSSWYKPEIIQDRKLDLIDEAVASMVRSIQAMKERGVAFSHETYLLLIASWRRCASVNNLLTPTQRLGALELLKARVSTASLEEILQSASKQ